MRLRSQRKSGKVFRFHKVNDMSQVLEQALTDPIVEPEVPVEVSVTSQPPV